MASHTPGAPVFAAPAQLPDWALRSIDLANPRLGAQALATSDDFFAEVARMLNPEPAQFVPGKFDTNGKWMDGWESRRKRVAGHDWALIKLGVKGVIAKSFARIHSDNLVNNGILPMTSDEDIAEGWILACCSNPMGRITVEV